MTAAKKRGPGRPRLKDRSAVATATLNLRITREARERYAAAAALEGMTLTAWVLALADAAAPKEGAQ